MGEKEEKEEKKCKGKKKEKKVMLELETYTLFRMTFGKMILILKRKGGKEEGKDGGRDEERVNAGFCVCVFCLPSV